MNSNPEAFGSPFFQDGEACTLLVAVSLSAVRTLEADIVSMSERSMFDSLLQFSLLSAAFFGDLDDEEFFVIEGSCQLDRDAMST